MKDKIEQVHGSEQGTKLSPLRRFPKRWFVVSSISGSKSLHGPGRKHIVEVISSET